MASPKHFPDQRIVCDTEVTIEHKVEEEIMQLISECWEDSYNVKSIGLNTSSSQSGEGNRIILLICT